VNIYWRLTSKYLLSASRQQTVQNQQKWFSKHQSIKPSEWPNRLTQTFLFLTAQTRLSLIYHELELDLKLSEHENKIKSRNTRKLTELHTDWIMTDTKRQTELFETSWYSQIFRNCQIKDVIQMYLISNFLIMLIIFSPIFKNASFILKRCQNSFNIKVYHCNNGIQCIYNFIS